MRVRTVTFTQLRTFALVAELGSLRAAAAALGVSEPAVSAAVTALRTDLGDPLFRRSGAGIVLTPGGRALAGHARELVRLADRTRRDVHRASTPAGLRVLASAACAEHLAPLLTAFAERVPGPGIDLAVGQSDIAEALGDDLYDLALGPWLPPLPSQSLEAVPFLRYRRIVVTTPQHPLAGGRGPVTVQALGGQRWLTGPDGPDAGSAEARWLERAAGGQEQVRLGSEAEALDAARSGRGLMLALVHLVAEDIRRGALVLLPAAGTPVEGMWWATISGHGRATAAARALQRFLTTPDATTALLARPRRPNRSRPTVRVELWS
jgi:DNA-binding transcriptional LysR family regulator